jgi:hypothetical protein
MYRSLTQLSALLMVGLGLTMLVVTLWQGGGVGIILGALFVAAGGARLWLVRRRIR